MNPILIAILLFSIPVSAQHLQKPDLNPADASQQSPGKFQIGLHISPFRFFDSNLVLYTEGAGGSDYPPEFSEKSQLSYGISAYYRINNFMSIGTGATHGNLLIKRHYYTFPPDSQKLSLLEIPLILRFEFLKYIYANQGLICHFVLSEPGIISSQTRFGYFMSLGFSYNLKSGLSVHLGPVMKGYSVSTHKEGELIIFEAEINLGILVRL